MKTTSYDELYPGRFMKASVDIGEKGAQQTFVIDHAEIDELEGDRGKEMKAILHFRDAKPHVMCKTNGLCLREMFGRELANWRNKRVTLFATETKDQRSGEMVPCVRVWGSPDIDRQFDVTIAFPRKKPFVMAMHKTGDARRESGAPAARNEPGELCKAFLQRLKMAPDMLEIEVIASESAQADLTESELQLMIRAVERRRGQVSGETE